MHSVALSAAIFGAAFFISAPSSTPVAASLAGTKNINTIISKNADPQITARRGDVDVSKTHASAKLASAEQNAASPSDKTVMVQDGDYLMKIADSNGTTYPRLYDANTAISDPNLIFPGQELRVPQTDEVLASRP